MEKNIGNVIAEHRKKKGLTLVGLARRLSDYGYSYTRQAVAKWENNASVPNANQIFALCDILDIDDPLWEFAGIHKGPFTGLNALGRERAKEYIDALFHVDKYRDDPLEEEAEEYEPRHLPLYEIGVSAGTGNFLDESPYELVEAPKHVPDSADFALRVEGDSMEPMIRDGQIIWIRQQPILYHGDIGVFHYRENAYCKRYIEAGGGIILRSLNKAYEDIEVDPSEDFRVFGKVVS